MTAPEVSARAEIVIDLGAIRHNVRRLRELTSMGSDAAAPQLMVVVKADGYGHGMVPVARAAREAGAEWLGVATLDEALAVRDSGDNGRLLCWLAVPGEDFGPAIAADIDVSAYTPSQLEEIVTAVTGPPARVQLKFDTGLSRGGADHRDWEALIAAAVAAERAGRIKVTGLWSHFACADTPEHPANDVQEAAFGEAVGLAEAAGLTPEVRHLANSAGAILRPSARFDLVRLGIAAYGLTPAPGVASSDSLGLRPAMTVRTRVAQTKQLTAGAGVSYGHMFVAEKPMRVALVPLGYADGIPRHGSSTAQVLVGGRRANILGRICMDQFVTEASTAEPGDPVIILGPGDQGEPTAQDWAQWCDTISYEILSQMGGRQTRRWVE